ncbi:SMI1/KNR4 family protein [Deinococcus cellulosilyticus]|uniref:Knr4/Smi1-like domain-containing protein n=1 Tax=Deinococcus cellulosilyticus (strain DSM 18568 / NBRC 106333 / KACC 11606 / 5516J-15) TaxID=1223518 RepID=A0A511N768_DEIC1|nr:SMI1/KNR4 family protein [Deinococcus cellulosilyticus]GEM48692.1 hypothetical protein DC3_43270 [Deinococcus cellulosilyticus NBRC 106333 = KACC 11606]
MTNSTLNLWEQLMEWLQNQYPEALPTLMPLACPLDWEDLQKRTGLAVPEDFTSIYHTHNGQVPYTIEGIFLGLSWMGFEEIKEAWLMFEDIKRQLPEEPTFEWQRAFPAGYAKPIPISPLRLPFATDWCGNYLGFDFDPDKQGTPGQVISFGSDEDHVHVLASSFEGFLGWLLSKYQQGEWGFEGVDVDGEESKSLKARVDGELAPNLFMALDQWQKG